MSSSMCTNQYTVHTLNVTIVLDLKVPQEANISV